MEHVVASVVEELVADIRTSVDGELSSRTQVVDHLLDLRLAGREHPATLTVIDRLLGELPGRTTVANAWWLESLVEIERAASAVGLEAIEPVGPGIESR